MTETKVSIFWYIAIISLFEYLDVQSIQITILSILMLVDLVTWLLKQYSIDKNEITSYKGWRWVIKKVLTLMFLLSFALMFKWVWIDWTTYIKSVFSILIVAEFYSVTQNTYSFMTWKKVNEFDAVSIIIKYIWEILIKNIEKFIWEKKNDIK